MVLKKGSNGKIKLGNDEVIDIGEWKADIELTDEEVTAFGDTWDDFEVVGAAWSGSFTGKYNPDDAGQQALESAFLSLNNTVTLKLYYDTDKYYTGTALLTKYSVDTAVKKIISIDVSFKGKGAITKGTDV